MLTKTVELEEAETRTLLLEYKKLGDSKVKNKIVKKYLSLVQKIARTYSRNNAQQFDDLVQVGCIGLIRAIERFDLNQMVSFKTYSSHFIVGEIKHFLRDHSSLVKLPRELQELQPKINRMKQTLSFENGKDATEEELSDKLEIPLEKIRQVLEMEKVSISISIDQPISNQDESNSKTIGEHLEDKKYSSFQLAQEDRIILNEAIKSIKDQSRQIIEYTFYQDLSQTEIAKKMGISQMQVSRKIKSAVNELWDILNSRVTPW